MGSFITPSISRLIFLALIVGSRADPCASDIGTATADIGKVRRMLMVQLTRCFL